MNTNVFNEDTNCNYDEKYSHKFVEKYILFYGIFHKNEKNQAKAGKLL